MTATDSAGDVSVSTLTVVVAFVAPTAQIVGVPANDYVPEGYAFSLAGVIDNPTPSNGLTESWTVTAGDGSDSPYTESGPNVTYTPDDIGSYTVTLNLLDASNQVVASTAQQILSIGVAPTATISGGPSGGTTTEGTPVAFTGAASSPSSVTSGNGFFYTWSVTLDGFTYVAPTTPTTNPTSFSFTPGQAGILRRLALGHGLSRVHQLGGHADDRRRGSRPCGDDHGPARRRRSRGDDGRSRQHRHEPQCRSGECRFFRVMEHPVRRGNLRALLRPGAGPDAGLCRQLYGRPRGHGCRGHLDHDD